MASVAELSLSFGYNSDVAEQTRPAGAREDEKRAARCDICGAPMREFNCELICTKCGYRRDCSDP